MRGLVKHSTRYRSISHFVNRFTFFNQIVFGEKTLPPFNISGSKGHDLVECIALKINHMLTLNSKQIRHLRSTSHALEPIVTIGSNGLSESVLKEIDRSLSAHELMKIKVQGDDRELRASLMQNICESLNAVAIQHIGKLLIIYRPAQKPKLILP